MTLSQRGDMQLFNLHDKEDQEADGSVGTQWSHGDLSEDRLAKHNH